MRGAWLTGCLLLTLLFSGCVGGEEPPAPAAGAGPDGDATNPIGDATTMADAPSAAPVVTSIPVDWTGQTGTGVFLCEYETGTVCDDHEISVEDNGVLVPLETGILRSLTLTLTWTAETPVNEELTFGVMTMASDCADCSSEMLESIEGTSPLVVALDNLDLQVFDGQTVHAFAYNDQLLYHQAPLVAQVRVDQALAIAGTVTVEEAPAGDDPHADH